MRTSAEVVKKSNRIEPLHVKAAAPQVRLKAIEKRLFFDRNLAVAVASVSTITYPTAI
ncbi:hypothetical protein [Geothermobacter hydrogeniphilus]|uniref:hypothetical protein n=1 Tax=Geothermobacter hydrogeniphilus TaxID=1969733 RepID=UPI001304E1B3|nr:hypothetical protein [Geothermobacter hydrogeniphilus]